MKSSIIFQFLQAIIERPSVRYLIVGGSTNLALLALYASLTFFGAPEVVASSIGYTTGILVTYIFNRGWTFRDQPSSRATLIKYVVAYGAGYVAQITILYGLMVHLNFPHIIAQIVAMAAAVIIIFSMLKFFVFKKFKH